VIVDIAMAVGFFLMLYGAILLVFQHQFSAMHFIGGLSIFLMTLYWRVDDNGE